MPNGTYLYDITGANITTMPGLFQFVQTVAPISELSIIIVCFVTFVAVVSKWGITSAFTSMAFIGLLFSMFFLILQTLSEIWLYAFAVMMAVSLILLYFEKHD